MEDSLSVRILIASIEFSKMVPVVASIKTLADTEVKCNTVSERLIEKWRGLRNTFCTSASMEAVKFKCNFCTRLGYHSENCCINTDNSDNRLDSIRNRGRNRSEDLTTPFF